jgi:hypothetical protein
MVGERVVGEGGVEEEEEEEGVEVERAATGGGFSALRRMVLVLLGRLVKELASPRGIGDSVSFLVSK